MINIYKTSFENLNNNIKSKGNMNQPLFDNVNLRNFYKNNYSSELILFEKDIISNSQKYINIYLYPITTKKIEGIFSNSEKDIILSYPIIISIKIDNSLEDLESLIIQKFKKFLNKEKNQKYEIQICFPHLTKE